MRTMILLLLWFGVAALPPAAGAAPANEAARLHQGQGTIKDVDTQKGTVKIRHDAIGSLNWPAMVMDFKVQNPQMLRRLKAGQQVDFQLQTSGSDGQYVISKITPTNHTKTR